MGRIPYGEKEGESPQAVLDIYMETGSFNKTARVLNERGIPSWSGKPWTPSGVQSVLGKRFRRLPTAQGAKRYTNKFRLYRLLRCHCGKFLTASYGGRGQPVVQYRCQNAATNPNHPRPYVLSESKILPLVQEEVGDLVNLVFVHDKEVDLERKTQLTEKRSRVVESFLDGVIDKQERDQRLLAIDQELSSLESRQTITTIPDWDDEPRAVNEFLRSLFGEIQLDAQMQPTFDWKIKVRALRDKVPEPRKITLDK